ncbi:mucin-2-like [Syngnathoides biaculeatus]|uniref:mucin-2-like n=1 Tax=Syngnathoides biaculeatus TaxID=300417 RepID=UPI002ADE75CC|nr:mucin-2-like [Syngnathoides biaculeatus]
MGTGTWIRTGLLLSLALTGADAGNASEGALPACSTWGRSHWRTADGATFRLPSACNHRLAADCGGPYETFDVQMRRREADGDGAIRAVLMRLDRDALELLADGGVRLNGKRARLPVAEPFVSVKKSSSGVLVSSKLGLRVAWNLDDALSIEIDKKYAGSICGLCGNFDGIDDELLRDGAALPVADYADRHKVSGPAETCEEEDEPAVPRDCPDKELCARALSAAAFGGCRDLADADDFIRACAADVCHAAARDPARLSEAVCRSVSEFSRSCVRAGGAPGTWRNATFCHQECPSGMTFAECAPSCPDSCSDPRASRTCDTRCHAGCSCPPGTVLDDVGRSGCVAVSRCPCSHDRRVYPAGHAFSQDCRTCACRGGRWRCSEDGECPGTCAVQGGAHVNTFDGKVYTFHGDCTYVLAKSNDSSYTVLVDLVQCGVSDARTCLRAVTLALNGNSSVVKIQASGQVLVNNILSQLPLFTPELSVFRPSSFYVLVGAGPGLRLTLQISPIMQLFLSAPASLKGSTSGLCGDFNDVMSDDFRVPSGLVEGAAAAFADTWKTRAACPDVRTRFGHPCARGISKESYARYWCSKLTDPGSAFAACHSLVSPETFRDNCMYDACTCEQSESCMCAAVSAYVHACSAAGIHIGGWRSEVCGRLSSCPAGTVYDYNMTSCGRTCRSLAGPDRACRTRFAAVDGCGCARGTYMDESGRCVAAAQCPCYLDDDIVPPGQAVNRQGCPCICRHGALSCAGGASAAAAQRCAAPKVYLNCSAAPPGSVGVECERSCGAVAALPCISGGCVSGCVCPDGLVSDGLGGCVDARGCPCVHNGRHYRPGHVLRADCNTCTCAAGRFTCTSKVCDGVCRFYGDGHHITFDDKRFDFHGRCEHTLVQDYCGDNDTTGTFRISSENVPCASSPTATCSKNVKIFIQDDEEFHLKDERFHVIRSRQPLFPPQVRQMGIYMVVAVKPGVVVTWDKKTSVFIKLAPDYRARVCGLCGNYDGNIRNDLAKRSGDSVTDAREFGNSWAPSGSGCLDAVLPVPPPDPCRANRYRAAWAQRQCSVIIGVTFDACHLQVDPGPYYDACVRDTCACDSGGDCECLCTAVAAYSKACNEAGACVRWRTPKFCPIFCDYYNAPGGCEWHYKACGADCMKTCRNPSGRCSQVIGGLEGCYPQCPPSRPYFDEDRMTCVSWDQCGCYDSMGGHYGLSEAVPAENCHTCLCTASGIQCNYNVNNCTCFIKGKVYVYGATIYNTTDGLGNCITATCGANGTVSRHVYPCFVTVGPTAHTTPFTFSTAGISTHVVTPTPSITTKVTTQKTTQEGNTSVQGKTTAASFTTTRGATTRPRETTTRKGTTIKTETTTTPRTTASPPTGTSTTVVGETTSFVPGVTTTATAYTGTSQPSFSSTTTKVPTTTKEGTTTRAGEITTRETTQPEFTPGPTTTYTTGVRDTTTFIPGVTTTATEYTVTSQPSFSTTTTKGETTPRVEETTTIEKTTTQGGTKTPELTTKSTITTIVEKTTTPSFSTGPTASTTFVGETTAQETSLPSVVTTTTKAGTTARTAQTTTSGITTRQGETTRSEFVTAPTATSITVVGKTTSVPGVITTKSEMTKTTSQPSVTTTNMRISTTVEGEITTQPEFTTGSRTNATTVVKTTNSVPGVATTSEFTEMTPHTSVGTSTTKIPITTSRQTTTGPGETTITQETTVKSEVTTPRSTTGPTMSPTVVGVTTTATKSTGTTPQLSFSTTTTKVPTTTKGGTTTRPDETTTTEVTTVKSEITTPRFTTGPKTKSTTVVGETTTFVPGLTTTQPELTVTTSQPSVSTTTTTIPIATSKQTTTRPGETSTTQTTVKSEVTTPRFTTGPKTKSTTVVGETTTFVPGLPTTQPELRVTTSQPFVSTTTTTIPLATSKQTTTRPGETTTTQTTVKSEITTPRFTTGPKTKSTTVVGETTTFVPGLTTTQPELTVTTSQPSVSTTTTTIPIATSKQTTTRPGETSTTQTTVKSEVTTPRFTTGPKTKSTTVVGETTTFVPGLPTTQPELRVTTSQPFVSTTTTTIPLATSKQTTTRPGETTTTQTTVKSEVTTPRFTAGPKTKSTTVVGETTTFVPGLTTTQPELTVTTSQPSVSTTTTTIPIATSKQTTTRPGETTTTQTTVKSEVTTPRFTTGPKTKSTTVVGETTTFVPGLPTTQPELRVTTSQPFVSTTTTTIPLATSKQTTTRPGETTTTQTTVKSEVTTPRFTAGPQTKSTTVVGETTTFVPGLPTTQPELRVVTTSQPFVSTTTTTIPLATSKQTTTRPGETTTTQTTVKSEITTPRFTTGPKTKSTTVVGETTTFVPGLTTTQPELTVTTSQPSVSTTTTKIRTTTSTQTTPRPGETTTTQTTVKSEVTTPRFSTGSTTSTTVVGETTTLVPGLTTTQPKLTETASQPFVSTTTTKIPILTSRQTTTRPGETTTTQETTAESEVTTPRFTTGATTTTVVGETTTFVPGLTTTQPELRVTTSQPFVSTTTTTIPIATSKQTTPRPGEATTTQETTAESEVTTPRFTTAPTTSTTVVGETTTLVPGLTTTQVELTVTTSQPSLSTTTTTIPIATSKQTTPRPGEATTTKETTVKSPITTQRFTTGPTTSTTVVGERTTLLPGIPTTQTKLTAMTSQRFVSTTIPIATSKQTIPRPGETTTTQETTAESEVTTPRFTTGATTTTVVGETTTFVPGLTTTQPELRVTTSQPFVSTTTTTIPIATSKQTTPRPGEATTTQETTAESEVTTPRFTTAPTTSTTVVGETTTLVPGLTTTQPKLTETASQPSVSTTTTTIPIATSKQTTPRPGEATTTKETTVKSPITTQRFTTGPTMSTTVVGETTTLVPGLTTTQPELTETASQPSVSTTTTKIPILTSRQTTTRPGETTITQETTVKSEVTTPRFTTGPTTSTTLVGETTTATKSTGTTSQPSFNRTTTTNVPTSTKWGTTTSPRETTITARFTTGTKTKSTSVVGETTTLIPGLTSTQAEFTGTFQPSVGTTTTKIPITTSRQTTTGPGETTTIQETTVKSEITTPRFTTSPRMSTTVVGEMTTATKSTGTTSQPSFSTTTTKVPTTEGGTPHRPGETTTTQETTAKSPITTSRFTTGPTISTTLVGETTTATKSTGTTSQPSFRTTTAKVPTVTKEVTTTIPGGITTTEGSTVKSDSTHKVTTGQTTISSTFVGETTTGSRYTGTTPQASFSTTTTRVPTTTQGQSTTRNAETTTGERTPGQSETTIQPQFTTGSTTEGSTVLGKTTIPSFTTNDYKETTSQPFISGTTREVPTKTSSRSSATTGGTSAREGTTANREASTTIRLSNIPTTNATFFTTSSLPSARTTSVFSTTEGVFTGGPQTTVVITKPSLLSTTVGTPTRLAGTTVSRATTQTLPGTVTAYTSGTTTSGQARTTASTSSLPFTTTLCFCFFNGTAYRPGDFVYNVSDGLGWCFVASCNASCQVETRSSLCPTHAPSTTARSTSSESRATTTTASLSTTTAANGASSSTTALDCSQASPPRKNGESWKVGNCTSATCVNGVIAESATACPTTQPLTCANGRKAVKVYDDDDDGCCFHYECQCVCSIWGESHFSTFDGKSYSFHENCSYYLVKEITAKHELTVVIDNHDCHPPDGDFCPQALNVAYKSHRVVLTRRKTSGLVRNVAFINQKQILSDWSNSVLRLTGRDQMTILEIPEIQSQVRYRGSSFSIHLPNSLFAGNTEGQCGTCDNSQHDDCRSPNGQVESCSDSADRWLVPGTPCGVTPTGSPVTTPTPSPTCKPAICDLITSSVFAGCHALVPPEPFFASCVSDVCGGADRSCSGLEAYAAQCSSEGICVDWRNSTRGQCELVCPGDKVYMACGPLVEPTCNDRYNRKFQAQSNGTREGCFCAQDSILFNSVHDTCVTSCDCVGPDGKPKQVGDVWTSDCNTCSCDGDSLSVLCQPVRCPPATADLTCDRPGQRSAAAVEGCCVVQSCECHANLCPPPPVCPPGFSLNFTNGTCCPAYTCEPKGVCVRNMTEYKPGAEIKMTRASDALVDISEPLGRTTAAPPAGPEFAGAGACQECVCGDVADPRTGLHGIICAPVQCNRNCSRGFQYQVAPSQCCGTCVQTSCVVVTPDNATHVIAVNGTFLWPGDACTTLTCQRVDGHPVTKETKTACPPFDPLYCKPGSETTDARGCCRRCELRDACQVRTRRSFLEVNGCRSGAPVNVTSCAGRCWSSSTYSAAADAISRQCDCCHESATGRRQVELTCPDGSTQLHSATVVEACHCAPTACGAAGPERRP